MTISLGILCKDGVVLASDGMVSLNAYNTNFVGIDNLKIYIVQNFIFGFAGNDDLMRHFVSYMSEVELTAENPNLLVSNICSNFLYYYYKFYNNYPEQIKNQILTKFHNDIANSQLNILFAFYINNDFYLYEIGQNLQFAQIKQDCSWYKIVGSGDLVGYPSIGLINNLLNIKSAPSVDEAIIIAHWTIEQAIDTSSGGIGGNVTIACLKNENDTFRSNYCDTNDSKEYMLDFYKHVHSFKKGIKEIKEDCTIDSIPPL